MFLSSVADNREIVTLKIENNPNTHTIIRRSDGKGAQQKQNMPVVTHIHQQGYF